MTVKLVKEDLPNEQDLSLYFGEACVEANIFSDADFDKVASEIIRIADIGVSLDSTREDAYAIAAPYVKSFLKQYGRPTGEVDNNHSESAPSNIYKGEAFDELNRFLESRTNWAPYILGDFTLLLLQIIPPTTMKTSSGSFVEIAYQQLKKMIDNDDSMLDEIVDRVEKPYKDKVSRYLL